MLMSLHWQKLVCIGAAERLKNLKNCLTFFIDLRLASALMRHSFACARLSYYLDCFVCTNMLGTVGLSRCSPPRFAFADCSFRRVVMIANLCFSKDRAFQLREYCRTLHAFCERSVVHEIHLPLRTAKPSEIRITVLYAASDKHVKSYEKLRDELPEVRSSAAQSFLSRRCAGQISARDQKTWRDIS